MCKFVIEVMVENFEDCILQIERGHLHYFSLDIDLPSIVYGEYKEMKMKVYSHCVILLLILTYNFIVYDKIAYVFARYFY